MRPLRFALTASLLGLVAIPTGTTPADAQVFCRCECQVQVIPYGNGFLRRRICRRHCWREAPRYLESPPVYRYTPPQLTHRPPVPQYATPFSPPALTLPTVKLPSLPKIPAEIIAIFVMCGAGILIARLIRHVSAVIAQRRFERRVLSTRALKKRLERDAYDTDQLIRSYAADAYRHGRDS